jgi:hypothetical protein
LIVAAEMFNVALPVLLSVIVCEELLPTFTLLKFTELGLIPNCACVVTPDPLRLMTRGEFGAELVTETVPEALPDAVGANVAVNVAVCPAVSVCEASALILKPVPLALAPLIVRLAVPLLVKVTFTDDEFPIKMLPKLILAGFALKAP